MTKNVVFNVIASLVSILSHFLIITAFEQLGYTKAFLVYTSYLTVLFLTGFFDFGHLINYANRFPKLSNSKLNSLKLTRIIIGLFFYYACSGVLLYLALYFEIILSEVNLAATLTVLLTLAIVTKGIANIPITLLRIRKEEFKASQNLMIVNFLRLTFFGSLFFVVLNEGKLLYYLFTWIIFINFCELCLHLIRLNLRIEFRPARFSKRFLANSFRYFKISATSSYLKGFDKLLAGNSLNHSLSEFNTSIMFFGLCSAFNGAISGNFLTYLNKKTKRKDKISITLKTLFFITIIYLIGFVAWQLLSENILTFAFLSLDVATIRIVVTLYIIGGWIASIQQVLYMVRLSANILENYIFALVALGILVTIITNFLEIDILLLPLIFISIYFVLLCEHARNLYLKWDRI